MDTAELIRAMKDREDDALAEFQTAYTPLIRYIITPILSDEADREECLSDVLMRAWDSFPTFDPQRAALTTWLTVLARNAALNRRRDNEKRQSDTVLDETLADPAPTPEQALLQKERVQAVQKAVNALHPRDKALFYRKYYYYQSTAQIAAELGLSERAVEGRLYRIRKRLQNELGGDGHD